MARERRPDDRQRRKQAVDKFHGAMTRMANSPAIVAIVQAVHTPVESLRRPDASARCPITGASSAMTRPAPPIA